MDNPLLRTEKPIELKDILTYYVNMFNDTLIANTIDLNHHTEIKKENPNYKIINTAGRLVTVDQLIETNKNGIRYARRNGLYVVELLDRLEKGTLPELWTDEVIGLIVSPIQEKDGVLEEVKVEEDTDKPEKKSEDKK